MPPKATHSVPARFAGNGKETAQLLGISEPALVKAVRERGCPIAVPGAKGTEAVYDWRAVVAWRTDELRAAAKQLDVERARLSRAQAERTELELQRGRGRVVDRARMEQAMSEVLVTVRESLLAIPDRVAAIIAAETDEQRVRASISAEIRGSLEALVVRMGDDGAPQGRSATH